MTVAKRQGREKPMKTEQTEQRNRKQNKGRSEDQSEDLR